MAAANCHGLGALGGHPLADRARACHLLGVGNPHGVRFIDLLCVGDVHLVGGRSLFGVGNVDLVGRRPLLLDRHHHRVGLLTLLGVGNLHRPLAALLFFHRHHHRVRLLTLLGVGNGHLVLLRPRLGDVDVDGVVDRLRPRFRHHHGVVPGALLGPWHLLRDGVRPLTLLGRPLGRFDVAALRDPSHPLHGLHACIAGNGVGCRTLDHGIAHKNGALGRDARHGILTAGETAANTHAGSRQPRQKAESQSLLHRNLQRKKNT